MSRAQHAPTAGWVERIRHASRSLIVRLILLAVVLIVVALIGRILILMPFLKENLTDLTSAQLLSISQYVARDTDERIRSRVELIDKLAKFAPRQLLDDRADLTRWLAEHHETYPKFSRGLMVVSAKTKKIVGEFPSVPGRMDLDFSQSDWFVKALEGKEAVIGRPMRSRLDGEPVIVMAAPIQDAQGRPLAVLAGVAEIGAHDFLDQIQSKRIGKTGSFLLISPKDNLFVSSGKPEMILKPLPKPGVNLLHDRAMAGYRGTGITVNAFGVEELSAMTSVPYTDWFLVARLPTSEAFEVIEKSYNFLIARGIVMGGGVILFLLWFLPRMFRPLVNTSRLIHRMAEGEIELQPVPVVRKDEVGDVALGFNYLLSRLNEMTDQKLAQERLRLIEREQMENSLRQWMADTSHELRTPISVMRAQIEAIQDGIHQADSHTLDVLHREVMGLTQLVDDLYTLARSDVGRLDGQTIPVEPLEILDETVQAFYSRFAEAGLRLDQSGRAMSSAVVLGDPARLKQIFSNLLENSLRYTDKGGRLKIESAVVQGRLVIYFDDSGPGVPDGALGRLFERFYRVDTSRSRDHGGSGIGLAVCRSLIEAMGGAIKAAHSDLGGLRIILTLPCTAGGTA